MHTSLLQLYTPFYYAPRQRNCLVRKTITQKTSNLLQAFMSSDGGCQSKHIYNKTANYFINTLHALVQYATGRQLPASNSS